MSTRKQPDARLQHHTYMTKRAWRRWAKQTRQGLPLAQRSAAVCDVLASSSLIHTANHILAYLPTPFELDLRSLLEALQHQGKRIYLTRTWAEHRQLSIHDVTGLEMDRLERHPFGYLQPPLDAALVDPKIVGLMLLPGLCFDLAGARLGYGMGHIDRLLARTPRAHKVGVVAHELVVNRLPQETTDIRMDALATDQQILNCMN